MLFTYKSPFARAVNVPAALIKNGVALEPKLAPPASIVISWPVTAAPEVATLINAAPVLILTSKLTGAATCLTRTSASDPM